MSEYKLTEKSLYILKQDIIQIINLQKNNNYLHYKIYINNSYLKILYNHKKYYVTILENRNNHKFYYYIRGNKKLLVLKNNYVNIVKILKLIINI